MIVVERIVHTIAPHAAPYVPQLTLQMGKRGISSTVPRAAAFLANLHHESGSFRLVRENLEYSAERLREVFGNRIDRDTALRVGRTPTQRADKVGIANAVYGGEWGRKNLGNTEPGDGARFIGRGLMQVTGRDNYRALSRWWLGDDSLLGQPERVEMPDGAVASAVWFWDSRGLNKLADVGQFEAIVKKINGGKIGLDSRQDLYRRYKIVLGA